MAYDFGIGFEVNDFLVNLQAELDTMSYPTPAFHTDGHIWWESAQYTTDGPLGSTAVPVHEELWNAAGPATTMGQEEGEWSFLDKWCSDDLSVCGLTPIGQDPVQSTAGGSVPAHVSMSAWVSPAIVSNPIQFGQDLRFHAATPQHRLCRSRSYPGGSANTGAPPSITIATNAVENENRNILIALSEDEEDGEKNEEPENEVVYEVTVPLTVSQTWSAIIASVTPQGQKNKKPTNTSTYKTTK